MITNFLTIYYPPNIGGLELSIILRVVLEAAAAWVVVKFGYGGDPGKDCAGRDSREEPPVPRPGSILRVVDGAVRCICCGAAWGNCGCGERPRCHRLGCMECVDHCVHGRLERMGKMAVQLAIERHDLLEENEMLRQELTVRGIKLPALRGRE